MELTLDPALFSTNNDGLQELVILALLVPLLNRSKRVAALLALSSDQTLETDLDTVPPLVAVHDIVTTDNCCDLASTDFLGGFEQVCHVSSAGLGVGVAAVTEEVDENLRDAHLLSDFEKSDQVVDVGVDTAIRHQTTEVKPAVAVDSPLEGLLDILDLAKLVVLDRLPNANRVLPDDATGANVQVANLAVAHEALRKTDGEGRGLELGVALGSLGAILHELVHGRSLRGVNGITILTVRCRTGCRDTPSVNDDKHGLLVDLHHVRGSIGQVVRRKGARGKCQAAK